jgi:hypothetical protein
LRIADCELSIWSSAEKVVLINRAVIAVFDDDVFGQHFVAVDTFEPGDKIGSLFAPAWLGWRRGRKESDSFAAPADAHGVTFLDPIQDAAKVVPQLCGRGRFHGEQ